MRPRISKNEAAFIGELLDRTKPELAEKQQRIRELKFLISEIFNEVHLRGNAYAIISEGYQAKKQELAKLKAEVEQAEQYLELHERLTEKYRILARGTKTNGRYPWQAMVREYPKGAVP